MKDISIHGWERWMIIYIKIGKGEVLKMNDGSCIYVVGY